MKILSLLFAMLLMVGMASATYTTMTAKTLDYDNDWTRSVGSWTTIAGNGSTNNFAMSDDYRYLLLVNITSYDVSDPTVDVLNVMAGDNPPAFRAGIGNLTLTMDDIVNIGTVVVGPLETARFKNSTGYCNIGSYMISGTMAVLKVK